MCNTYALQAGTNTQTNSHANKLAHLYTPRIKQTNTRITCIFIYTGTDTKMHAQIRPHKNMGDTIKNINLKTSCKPLETKEKETNLDD